MTTIAQPSLMSLRITMHVGEKELATGTGFIATSASRRPMLMTSRHNLTGRDQNNGKLLSNTGVVPDRIIIRHNATSRAGAFVETPEALYDASGRPLWKEHPSLGKDADLVALPLSSLFGIQLMAYAVMQPSDIVVRPTDRISLVGYPFGLDVREMAIWAAGFAATEPDLETEPMFLIDCRTRPGQSGSPVIAYRGPGISTMLDGTSIARNEASWRFLGLYSGQVNAETDLGIVWKAATVAELLASL